MKSIFFFLFIFFPVLLMGQFERLGGGLAFSSGALYNFNRTGNPGIWIKPYVKILPKTFFVPSVTVFNRYKKSTFTEEIRNYMFHADADIQYQVFLQDEIKIFLLAGLNATGLISRYEMKVALQGEGLDNKSALGLGANIGGGLEMVINDYYDAVLLTKYTAGAYNQFVINLGILYYLNPKKYRRGR